MTDTAGRWSKTVDAGTFAIDLGTVPSRHGFMLLFRLRSPEETIRLATRRWWPTPDFAIAAGLAVVDQIVPRQPAKAGNR